MSESDDYVRTLALRGASRVTLSAFQKAADPGAPSAPIISQGALMRRS